MRGLSLSVLLLLGALAGAQAGARADQPTAAAEHAAAVGDYRSAAQSYEQVLARNGFSAPVLFDLGNDWLRLGKPGRAILDYERALVLAPGSAAIESNLAAAQQRAAITPEVVGPWLSAARHFSINTYAWLGLGAIWVLCAALVLLCFGGTLRRLARPLILVAAVTLCVSVDAAALCWSDLYRVVVVQGPAVLHVAPAQSAAPNGALREGEVAWLEDRYAGFNLVRTADGHSGWISEDAAVPVRAARL